MPRSRSHWWCTFLFLAAGCGQAGPGPEDGGFTPYEPPATDHPFVDAVYLQEFNHTSPELEDGVGPLLAVLLPPAGVNGFEAPTLVGPRGLIRHDGAGAVETVAIAEDAADLRFAAFGAGALWVASTDALYRHDGTAFVAQAPPAGQIIAGLAPGAAVIYVLTDQGLGLADASASHWPTGEPALTAALEHGDDLYLATSDTLRAHPRPQSPQALAAASWTLDAAGGLAVGRPAALVAQVDLPQALDLVVVGSDGLQGLLLAGGTPQLTAVPAFAADRVPLAEPVAAARLSDGGFAVATRGGAYRIMDRGIGPEWRVYNAERWLPHEDVRGLASDPGQADGPIWFATASGLATVTAQRITLEDKLVDFVARIVDRHDRDGAVADSRLGARGDLSTSVPYDSDNDGGWTCYWILAECFRYRVSGDPAAKAHFDKSLARMLSFRTLTGTEHFLARAVIRKEGCVLDDCDGPDDGEWFTSPDGEWWVKADTSNDEVTSHMFMMGHAYDLCADDEQKAAIRDHVDGIIGGIIDNGYQLLDLDGEVTSYGQFDPEYVHGLLAGEYADGGRRAAQIIAAINLAYYMTGDQKYLDAKQDLLVNHDYREPIIHESEPEFRRGSGDGDELGTQAFFVLLRYEQDPELLADWREGWRRSYGNMREQQGALWDMVNGVLGGADPQFEMAGRWLRLAPVDMIRWNQHNSQRRDLVRAPEYYKPEGRMRSDGTIIPYDERPCDRWNTNQYKADGGFDGWSEMDGADVLMPYWMGRYYGFITPAE